MHPADSSARPTVFGVETRSIAVTDAAFLFFAVVANVVIVILTLRLMALFTPFRVATIAALCTFLLLRAAGITRIGRDARLSWWLVGAILAGLFMAGHLAPHYQAGQDQGFYTAMAEMLARGEPITFVDRFRESLPADLRQIYDSMKVWAIEERPGGRQVIQFYSLHPALMAFATQLLGKGYHTVFMLLAFVICIAAMYVITFELTNGSRGLAGLAAWLVALNPAYVFFAKFPVTEITAAAMISLSFYFLLIGYRAPPRRAMVLNGFVALLFMNGFCFTRMSFPEIAPFLMVLAAVLFFVPGVRLGQRLFVLAFVVLSFACYALSMIYYHAVMPQLFWAIMELAYLPALRRGRWLIGAGIIGGLVVLAALALPATRARTMNAITWLLAIGERTILRFPGLILLAVALPSMILLIQTGKFEAFAVSQSPGLQMVRFHSIYVLMLFVSPFLFAVLLAGTRPLQEEDRSRLLPVLLLLAVWPVYMTFASSMPYLYYYGRYLLPEVLPAAIIVGVLALETSWLPRRVTAGLAAAALAYSAYFSLVQLRHAEGEVGRPFHQIAERLAQGDVLVVDGGRFVEGVRSQIVIPIRYALDVPTFILPPGTVESRLQIFDRLRAVTQGKMYFLTSSESTDIANWLRSGFEKVVSVPFGGNYLRMIDDPSRLRGWLLPHRVTPAFGAPFILYKVPERFEPTASLGKRFEMSESGTGHLLTREGWSVQEKNHRWTVGSTARLVFDVPSDRVKEAGLRLTLRAATFQDQTVEFAAGSQPLGQRGMSPATEELTFDIPASAVRNNQLEITLHLPDARSPQSVGVSNDPRILGLALLWIQLEAK